MDALEVGGGKLQHRNERTTGHRRLARGCGALGVGRRNVWLQAKGMMSAHVKLESYFDACVTLVRAWSVCLGVLIAALSNLSIYPPSRSSPSLPTSIRYPRTLELPVLRYSIRNLSPTPLRFSIHHFSRTPAMRPTQAILRPLTERVLTGSGVRIARNSHAASSMQTAATNTIRDYVVRAICLFHSKCSNTLLPGT